MWEGLTVENMTGWGTVGGLLVLLVVALVRGWIVPGSTVRMWFEAWQTDRKTVERLADQNEQMLAGQQTITHFIGEIKAAGEVVERREPPS